MQLSLCFLLLAGLASGKGPPRTRAQQRQKQQQPTLYSFLQRNDLEYGWIASSLEMLGEPYTTDSSLTLLLPPPSGKNSSAFAKELAALPLRTLEGYVGWLFLPTAYSQPEELAAAGEVVTMAHTSAHFSWGEKNLIAAVFEGVGTAAVKATVLPTALPIGKSVVYLMKDASFLEPLPNNSPTSNNIITSNLSSPDAYQLTQGISDALSGKLEVDDEANITVASLPGLLAPWRPPIWPVGAAEVSESPAEVAPAPAPGTSHRRRRRLW
ncbi:hypothetical protein N2152v2_005703 [Parachlorella kessleri]